MVIKRFIPVIAFIALAMASGILIQRSLTRANEPLLPADHPKVVAGNLPTVTLYSTEWCGYCKAARSYFTRKQIPFVERDIEKDAAAHRQFQALGGGGVPLIVVDRVRISGFDQGQFKDTYLAAVNE